MATKTVDEVRSTIQQLSAQVWQLSVLSAAVEAGLVEPLAERRSIAWLAERARLSPLLVERLLDVLVAMGLVVRDGDGYVAGPGFAAASLEPVRFDALRHDLRATFGQSRHLVTAARAGELVGGWRHTDPEILVAQGKSGGGGMDMMVKTLIGMLEGLSGRFERPGASFLDVGSGVSEISIQFCRWYPQLCAVGLEPGEAPRAEAAKNIAAAGMGERVTVRPQLVQELADVDAFDLAWVPQVFLPAEVYDAALRNVFRALRPGGWLLTLTFHTDGDDFVPAMARLRTTLWGGEPIGVDQVLARVRAVGFTDVRPVPMPPGSAPRPVVARKPELA